MAENLPNVDGELFPIIDDAVLADISGFHGLSPEELWNIVADTEIAPWALVEANRLTDAGATPKEAFLAGVGWFLEACRRQQARDADKAMIAAALGDAFTDGVPVTSPDHT